MNAEIKGPDHPQSGGLIPTHGGYRNLKSFQLAQLVYDVTVRFCDRYLVLRIAGLTQLALTVVGGTGLIGLVLGIAFREITENFLASLFLSLQQPFREGDLVEVANVTGYVQRLTSRTTVLMTLDGNQVQVPKRSFPKNRGPRSVRSERFRRKE